VIGGLVVYYWQEDRSVDAERHERGLEKEIFGGRGELTDKRL